MKENMPALVDELVGLTMKRVEQERVKAERAQRMLALIAEEIERCGNIDPVVKDVVLAYCKGT